MNCEECEREYAGGNSMSRFCSSACQQRAWRRKHPGYQSAATKRYLEASPDRQRRRKAYMEEYRQRPDAAATARERKRESYARSPEAAKARAVLQYAGVLRFLTAVKTTCGCVDCGVRVGNLHFDHRPGTVKLFDPSRGRSLPRLIAEIEKCDVRCASCHATRHERAKRAMA